MAKYAWTGLKLFRNGKVPVAELQGRGASSDYRGLFSYRLLPDGEWSDVYNFTRARDNARTAATDRDEGRIRKERTAPIKTVRAENAPLKKVRT